MCVCVCGVIQLFPVGGGGEVQLLISIETHITCDFPWGVPIPLWIRTCVFKISITHMDKHMVGSIMFILVLYILQVCPSG